MGGRYDAGELDAYQMTMKTILERTIGKDTKERQNIVADAWVGVGKKPRFKAKDYDIEIVDIKKVEVNGQVGVEIYARAWDKDGQIGFGRDGTVDIERFRSFGGLPFMVPDGTKDSEGNDNLKEDVFETIKQQISHTISVKKQKLSGDKIKAGKIGNTTTDFYATIKYSLNRIGAGESFTSIVNGNGTSFNTSLRTQIADNGSSWTTCQRGALTFNSAAIDTDEILSGIVSVQGATKFNDAHSVSISIDKYNPPDPTLYPPPTSGYQTVEDTRQSDTDIAYASVSTAAYNNWTLNATGLGNVSKVGYSTFIMRITADLTDTEPSKVNSYSLIDWNNAGVPPKLTVEHEAATADAARPAELTGSADSNAARPGEVSGTDTTDAARPAELSGKDSADAARPAEATGEDTGDAARPAEAHGKDTGDGSRPAETHGTDEGDDARPSEMHGFDIGDDARPAELHGVDTSNEVRPAELTGIDTEDDARPAEMHGFDTADDTRPAELHGTDDSDESRPAEVTGVDISDESRPAEIHGTDQDNAARPAEMTGANIGTGIRPAELSGIDSDSAERPAEVTGSDTADSARPAELHGKDTGIDSRPAEISGGNITDDSRPAEMTGFDTEESARSAVMTGYETADAARSAELNAEEDVTGERSAEMTGIAGTNASRGCSLEGEGYEIPIGSAVITSKEASAVLTTKETKL